MLHNELRCAKLATAKTYSTKKSPAKDRGFFNIVKRRILFLDNAFG